MRVPFDSRRNVFIHDFDGVYYRYEDKENYFDYLVECGALAGVDIFGDLLTHEQSKKIHGDSFLEHGAPHVGYLGFLEQIGLSPLEFKALYYQKYHTNKFGRAEKEVPFWIDKCEITVQNFSLLQPYVRHGLLTQSHLAEWALPVMLRKGILEYFDESCLLGFEEVDFEFKSKSSRPIEIALEQMNAIPAQAVFIEDSHKNLQVAKEKFPELCTILINENETSYDYVDVHVSDIQSFQALAIQSHVQHIKAQPKLRV